MENTAGDTFQEYRYNGLGYRTGWHYNVDGDATLEDTADDPWFYFAYDDSWRIAMTFRADDSDPKESFAYHNPGRGGRSASDLLLLRDKDADTSWADASDGTLEERVYSLHNWRGDVVELIDDAANRVESVRYSSYGVPFGMPPGDTDNDGDGDSADDSQFTTWINASTYDVRGDLDLDGDVDATDQSTFQSNYQGITLGRGKLSTGPDSGVGNRRGYASYEHDGNVDSVAHVRHRVLMIAIGKWSRRDPLGYVDGMNLYAYVATNPLASIDPRGLSRVCLTSSVPISVDPFDVIDRWLDGEFEDERLQNCRVNVHENDQYCEQHCHILYGLCGDTGPDAD